MKFIIIYITHKNLKEAKKIANHLLEKKLVGCVNFFPVQCSYLWNGKIENSKEIVTLVKTKKENWLKVKREVEKIHPYDVPCIMKLDVKANENYYKWIKQETKIIDENL